MTRSEAAGCDGSLWRRLLRGWFGTLVLPGIVLFIALFALPLLTVGWWRIVHADR